MLVDNLEAYLKTLTQKGLYRSRILFEESPQGIQFSSNDYLSLRNDPRIQKAFQKGYEKYPVGAGASMLISGFHPIHEALEKTLARHLGVDRALLFNSGFAANLAVIALFARLDAHLLVDKAVHASLYDGIRVANASYSRFAHQDIKQLAEKLTMSNKNQLIITESIFSMSGQKTDLQALKQLAMAHKTLLFVDEAHAFGLLGENGLGAVHEQGLDQETVPLRMISFGKAMGAQGAVVVGKAEWIEGLLQAGRSYIYSTGMSPAFAFGLLESLPILMQASDRREKLWNLVAYFNEKTQHSSLTWRDSQTPIQQLQVGCPFKAEALASELKKAGIHCLPIRAPTVSLPETGLRVVLNYHHSREDIDALFAALE